MDDRAGDDGRSPGLAEQRRRLTRVFGEGCVTPARGPVTFSEEELTRIDHVREHGGFLNAHEHEHLLRLRAGGQRGDPLPAAPETREPFISGLADDHEVRIDETEDQASVVVLFSHERWPGIRFGHRFPGPEQADGHEHIWLKEEIETGGLARLMARHPPADRDGIVWTDWSNR